MKPNIHTSAGLRLLTLPALQLDGFVHAFGTIDTGPSRPGAHRRLHRAFPQLEAIATVHQVHGRREVRIDSGEDAENFRRHDADILITGRPGLAVAVRTADCTPVLILDPVRRAVAAVHSGWRGTVAKAAARAVEALAENYGSQPRDLRAGVGPCVLPCHYQVDGPVIQGLHDALGPKAGQVLAPDGPDHARLDLSLANRIILEQAGLPAKNIQEVRLCTCCREDLFFSYRRQGKGVPSLYHLIAIA